MNTIALIPVRGGSKEIPKKNIKSFCGWPLIYRSLWPLLNSKVTWVFVATEDEEIKQTVLQFKAAYDVHGKLYVFDRSIENARDNSSTESLIEEFLANASSIGYITDKDNLIVVQCTNPFLQSIHVNEAIDMLPNYDSILSCCRMNRFLWHRDEQWGANPINYSIWNRPFRKDFKSDVFVENGSFYLSSIANIKYYHNRISGKIGIYEMPEWTATEIDSEIDWHMAEKIYRSLITLIDTSTYRVKR